MADSLSSAGRYSEAMRALELCESWQMVESSKNKNAFDIANSYVIAALSNGLLLVYHKERTHVWL